MRKRVFGRQFSRDKNERKALFRGLISALIERGEIVTTLPKAKAIKGQTEKLVTKAKNISVGCQRDLLSFLTKKTLVNKIVNEIAPLFKQRNGGYLRIVRLEKRTGDNAQMAKISFTEKIAPVIKAEKVKTKEVKKEVKKEITESKQEEVK